MIPMLGSALVIAPFSSIAGWRIIRFWKKTLLAIFGVQVSISYEQSPSQFDQGGIMLGLNQQSLLDPTIAYSAWDRPVMSIWNIEYALIPFFGWISFVLGWVIVRQHQGQSKRQLQKAAEYARNGGLVFISAEGQRSTDGHLNPYKKGPVVLAIESQSLIHPMYMTGSRNCMPVGAWKIKPGKVHLHCLSPISTNGLTYEDRNDLLKKIRDLGEREQHNWRTQLEDQMP